MKRAHQINTARKAGSIKAAKQNEIVANKEGLKKLASWALQNPDYVKQLSDKVNEIQNKEMKKSGSAPKFTLSETLKIIGTVADVLHKQADDKAKAEEEEACRLARIMKMAQNITQENK